MKTLIKIDKVIKIDPRNVIDLYKFVKRYIRWEPRDYLNELDKRFPNRFGNHTTAEIPLDIVILPSYMFLQVPSTLEGIIKPQHSDVIRPENFSYFGLYKVVDDPNGKIMDMVITIDVGYRRFDKVTEIQNMLLTIEYLQKQSQAKKREKIKKGGICSKIFLYLAC